MLPGSAPALEVRSARTRRRGSVSSAQAWAPARFTLSGAFFQAPWSVGFIGLLAYIYAIVSFGLPIGTAAGIVTFVGGMLLLPGRRIPPIVGLILVYYVWALLSTLASPWPSESRAAVIEFGKVVIVFSASAIILADPRAIVPAMLFAAACYLLYPVRGTIVGGDVIAGRAVWNYIYANPNDLAVLILLDTGIVLALSQLKWKSTVIRFALISVAALQTVVIVMTQSRGVMLGLVSIGVAAVVAAPNALRKRLLVVASVLAVGAYFLVPKDISDRYLTGLRDDPTITSRSDIRLRMAAGSRAERIAIANASVRIALRNPIIGVGFGAFPQALKEEAPEIGSLDTHNTYLNVACELGVPGLVLLFALIILLGRDARRALAAVRGARPDLSAALVLFGASIFGFWVAAFFGSYLKLTPPLLIMATFNAFCRAVEAGARGPAPKVPRATVTNGDARPMPA